MTSSQEAVRRCQISSSHASCSGFIRTERRQVTDSALAAKGRSGSNHRRGSCARARCKSLVAQASKTFCASAEDSSAVWARSFQTTMSSSGAPARSGWKRSALSARSRRSSSRAAALPRAIPRANSPPGTGGSSFCVAHKATAAAPAREHSKLISPRCNCFEVK